MKQFRVVALGDWHGYLSHFLYGAMEGTIRNGAWFRPVYLFQSLSEVEVQIKWFKPHLVIGHMFFNRRPHDPERTLDMLERIRKTGTKVAYHMGDAKSQPRYIGDISRGVDFALMNHGMLKEFSKIWKVPTYHWPYMCLYQKEIMETDKTFKHPVVFTGVLSKDGVHGARTKFIKELEKKIEVKLFPNALTGHTRFQTAELSSSAGVVLGVQMAKDIPLYTDVRPFQYPGAGALYFHDSDVLDKFLKPDYHYIKYETGNVKDFVEKYNYYVAKHPAEGQKIREQGFEFCQAFYSTKERMRFVMDIAQGKKINNRIYLDDLPV